MIKTHREFRLVVRQDRSTGNSQNVNRDGKWHGNDQQNDSAARSWSRLQEIRAAGLQQPSANRQGMQSAARFLHAQSDISPEMDHVSIPENRYAEHLRHIRGDAGTASNCRGAAIAL